MATDPIEKKPLYHYLPGTEILSVATYGCNLSCPFCQNSEISQNTVPGRYISPDTLVELARAEAVPAVAFTYTEPVVWFEYVLDSARLLRAAGLRVVLVTNGMINPDPLAELLPLVDAANIDLKSIRTEFYSDYVGGSLDAVLRTIEKVHRRWHIELTCLLIPGRNDSDDDIHQLVAFVASLARTIPLHFSRYFPRYRAKEPATAPAAVLRAAELAAKQLDYVYVGNVAAPERFRDTFCPRCHNRLVDRSLYRGRVVGCVDSRCARCGAEANLILMGSGVEKEA